MTLERAIAYIREDELVEVAPKSITLRKRYLDPHERKRQSRKAEPLRNKACSPIPAGR
jgi:GTP-binding protein